MWSRKFGPCLATANRVLIPAMLQADLKARQLDGSGLTPRARARTHAHSQTHIACRQGGSRTTDGQHFAVSSSSFCSVRSERRCQEEDSQAACHPCGRLTQPPSSVQVLLVLDLHEHTESHADGTRSRQGMCCGGRTSESPWKRGPWLPSSISPKTQPTLHMSTGVP
jgi:hypothetical protein